MIAPKILGLVAIAIFVDVTFSIDARDETVSKHGKLSLRGTQLVDQNGDPVQLKGMSLFWSQWMPYYWNKDTVDGVHEYCHANIVRASMAVDSIDGGYLNDSVAEMEKVETVIQAAIQNDIYVIVDWHEEEADQHQAQAVDFFDQISRKYGAYPNIIYEPCNEPTYQDWSSVLKPYHEAVIRAIRSNDPDNIIVVGTPQWSQKVDDAANDPITISTNIMYTLHFYAGTHKQWLRDTAQSALDRGIPIFVTEYGTVNADGDGAIDYDETELWWDWCDRNGISYVNWVIGDKNETSCVLIEDTPADKVCQSEYLTESGRYVIAKNSA